jgi:hypothetical protein
MTPSPTLPARAVDALRRGDTIEAIKLLRASSGLGLKDAKDVIDAFRRGGLPLPPRPPDTGTSRAAADAAEARHRVEQHAVVERMHTAAGFGLAKATDAGDASHFRDRPQGVGGRSPGEVPRAGPPLRWLALVALVAYVLYSLFGRR